MADEAVVRIVLQDAGGTVGSQPAANVTPAQTQQPPPPTQSTATPAPARPTTPLQPTTSAVTDPQVIADTHAALIALGRTKKEADALIANITTSGQPFADVTGALKAAFAKPAQGTAPPPAQNESTTAAQFDPVEAAKKRVEREDQLAAVDAEYAKLRPPMVTAAFDPVKEAKKRLEREKQLEAVDAEYEKLNPKSSFDKTIETIGKFRGLLGGVGGTLVGAGLDIIDALHKYKKEERSTDAGPASGGGSSAGGGGVIAGIGEMIGGPMGAIVAEVAIVAFKAYKAVVDSAVSLVKEGVGKVGQIGALIASGDDPTSPIAFFGQEVSKTGEKLALLNPVVGLTAIAFGETAKALAQVMQAINQTAQRYGEFNPQLAGALAQAEVRRTLGDFRRAQEAGPELARYVQAQADLQQKFEDIKVKLLTRLLEIVTPVLHLVEAFLPSGKTVDDIINILEIIAKLHPVGNMASTLKQIADMIRAATTQDYDPADILLNPNRGLMEPGVPLGGRDKFDRFEI